MGYAADNISECADNYDETHEQTVWIPEETDRFTRTYAMPSIASPVLCEKPYRHSHKIKK